MIGLTKRSAKTASTAIAVEGMDQDLRAASNETLLAALLRQEVKVNHLCLVGECGSCRCTLTKGRVKLKRDVSALLSDEDLRRGQILACQSIALSDVALRIPTAEEAAKDAAPRIGARIESLRKLAHNVIELTLAPEAQVSYRAGQYIQLSCPAEPALAGVSRCYSCAEAPDAHTTTGNRLQFHVRHVPGGRFTDWLFAADRAGTRLELSAAAGSFGYRATGRSMVCIAGGTGLAPILAILRSLRFNLGAARTVPAVTIMLAARTEADLYGFAELEALANQWPAKFTVLPILSNEPADSPWSGLRGFCTDHFDAFGTLSANDFYVCGPPAMIDAVAERLRGAVPDGQLHVDRFLDQSSAT